MKILIVEDDVLTIKLYNILFKDNDVTIVETGDAFMGQYSSKYDVLILDIRLPERNGFELITFLQAVDNQIPTFIITSTSFADFKKEVKNFKKYYFFQKPIDIKELKATVENINKY